MLYIAMYTYVHANIYLYVHVWICIYVYIYMYICRYIHTHDEFFRGVSLEEHLKASHVRSVGEASGDETWARKRLTTLVARC